MITCIGHLQTGHCIISDESTLRLVRGGSKLVRRPPESSRYYSKSMVNTVKYPESEMVWGAFSGNNGSCSLFFLPKNITLAGANYFEVLEHLMLPIWDNHQYHHFMHDGAAAHKSKHVKRFLEDREIPIWEWPCKSSYLNPIENA